MMDSQDEDFQEVPITENGEMVMLLAKGVGVLVGIVAIVSWLMIMMVFRAVLVWSLHLWGVLGVTVCLALTVALAMKYGQMSGKYICNMLLYSCN